MTRRARSAIFTRAAVEWAAMRDEYAVWLEAHMAAATEATCGVLLNRRGLAAGIDSGRLFTASPAFASAYASRELRDFWASSPRLTLAAFEAAWLTARDAAEEGEEVAGSTRLPEVWAA